MNNIPLKSCDRCGRQYLATTQCACVKKSESNKNNDLTKNIKTEEFDLFK